MYTRVRDGKTQTVTRRLNAHGESKTPLYRRWKGIQERCYNPSAGNYKFYGGKGVIVCDAWRGNYPAFRDWAHETGYSRDLELDRIDSAGPYSPDNCRWVTKKQNIRNRDRVWDDDLDAKLIGYAVENSLDPYEVIRIALERFLAAE